MSRLTDDDLPSNLGDQGEFIFERYLLARGLPFERERDSGDGTRPDFWVDVDGREVVCEVKSIRAAPPGEVGAMDPYGAIRRFIKKAGRQGSAVKGALAYVPVLYAPFLPVGLISVSGAMFGNVGFTMPVDVTTGTADVNRAETRFLGGGRIQPERNTRLSAVAVLRWHRPELARLRRAMDWSEPPEPMAQGIEDTWARVRRAADELRAAGRPIDEDLRAPGVDCFVNPWAAVPVGDLFVGPLDRVYSAVDDRFVLAATGIALAGYD